MGSKSKFWKGVIFGAIAGGAVSLFDKDTRESVKNSLSKTTESVSYYIKNPGVVVEQVKETTEKIRNTIEQVSEDVSFIAEKVDELKEITPAVAEIVKDTKDAFLPEEEQF